MFEALKNGSAEAVLIPRDSKRLTLKLANRSDRPREIELTSYVEIAQASLAEDAAHPADINEALQPVISNLSSKSLGGNEFMEWTDLFLHPKAMEWVEDFLKYTDKSIQFFTVGFVHVPKIHQLVAQYPGRINFELSVITLSDYRQRLMPHAPCPLQASLQSRWRTASRRCATSI